MRRLVAVLASLPARIAPARAWPDRPVPIILLFPAGGVPDIVARGLAQARSEQPGVAAGAVNRDGAAGTIGIRTLAAVAPDGHTLAFTPTPPITTRRQLIRNAGCSLASVQPHAAIRCSRASPAMP